MIGGRSTFYIFVYMKNQISKVTIWSILVIHWFRITFQNIRAVIGQEAICESPIVWTDRKGMAEFQGERFTWNDRTVNMTGKRRCVTKRQENRTQKIENRTIAGSLLLNESLFENVSVAEMKADCSKSPADAYPREESGLLGRHLCKICSDYLRNS